MTPLARELPLISCIMPTTGKRKRFVEQSIKLFNAQDYPNKELIIIDEPDYYGNSVFEFFQAQSNIEYVYIETLGTDVPLTVGAKRNLACSLARGDIICLWDDDDWHGPHRLSHQAQPIIDYEADITGFPLDIVLNAREGTAWRASSTLSQEIFTSGVVTGAVMFRKRLWGWMASFPSTSMGEDADFLRIACGQNATLVPIVNKGDFIYVRHEAINLWPLPPTPYLHMDEWQQVDINQYIPEEDQVFYKQFLSCQQDVLT